MKSFKIDTTSRSARKLLADRQKIGLSFTLLAVIGGCAALAGLGQAAILLILVRVGTALTANTQEITGTVGPFSAAELTTGYLLSFGAVVLLLLLVVEYAGSVAQARLYSGSLRTTQRRLLDAYTSASYDEQHRTSRGDTQQLLHVHTGQVAGLVNNVGNLTSALANFTVLVVSALVLSPVAAVVVLGGLAIMLIVLRPLMVRSRSYGERRANQQRAMAALFAERLELNREIRAFGVEKAANKTIDTQISNVAKTVEHLRVVARMTSVLYRLGAFALILAMLAVIDASNATNLAALTGSLLMLLRSLSYGQATQAALQTISELSPVVEQVSQAQDRFTSSSNTPETKIEEIDLVSATPPACPLTLDLRQISYDFDGRDETDRRLLEEIDLTIDAGEFVALIGPSGSGKSTLLSLLARLRTPQGGTIEVNNIEVDETDTRWWHQRVAYVPQEPRLESGSVIEAIRFGREWITPEMAKRGAERAHIADEIRSWPNAWSTEVGQLGEDLSGGQRQRVAIARALAGEPDVLLLDEPTSALDSVSESLISDTIEELRGEMTIFVIAHRLGTIQGADRVLRLEAGELAQVPKHSIVLDDTDPFKQGATA